MTRKIIPNPKTQTKDIDILLALIAHEWTEIHHTESQRASLTNILLIIESGSIALIVQGNHMINTLPICIMLTVFATVGVLATWKYYERFKYAQVRLTELYRRIDKLSPSTEVLDIHRSANAIHNSDTRVMILRKYHLRRLALNRVWYWVHFLFVLTGIGLAIIVLDLNGVLLP